ncbi:hypothetical protein BJ138DRAFT_1120749 [Hygrophoropsis aurantiaca]|uniref:Uncharacterized protein n=1 Tax=Hygrophoropsis aurantiaca TaxID=72124 RepID=A0ACB7ZPG3_9AGAM|nr:hypothetical protein BJ138DRAFT_1120749 [Hygrophoropsis aurantiaca]
MPPPRWTTAEQLDWLQRELPAFKQAQNDGSVNKFWEIMTHAWYKEFSERKNLWPPNGIPPGMSEDMGDADLPTEFAEILGSAISDRNDKLKNWYRNNSRVKITGTNSTSKLLAKLLGQRAQGIRDLNQIEVYSKLHYEDKVKPIVESEMAAKKTVEAGERLACIKMVTAQMYKEEGEDVKAAVKAEMLRRNKERRSPLDSSQSPEARAHALRELPVLLIQFFDNLHAFTGWHFSVYMGGPDPTKGEALTCQSYHHGQTMLGHTFQGVTRDFEEQFVDPYRKFLQDVFGGKKVSGVAALASDTCDLLAFAESPSTSSTDVANVIPDSGPRSPLHGDKDLLGPTNSSALPHLSGTGSDPTTSSPALHLTSLHDSQPQEWGTFDTPDLNSRMPTNDIGQPWWMPFNSLDGNTGNSDLAPQFNPNGWMPWNFNFNMPQTHASESRMLQAQ